MFHADRFFVAEIAVLLGIAVLGAAVGPVGAAPRDAGVPVTTMAPDTMVAEPRLLPPVMPPDFPPQPQVVPVQFAEPPPPVRSRTGIATCDRYLERLEELASCEKLPAESRQAIRQAVDQTEQAWNEARWDQMPGDARESVSTACSQATDAVAQSMSQLCP